LTSEAATHPEVFTHLRIIIGMVLGISITRLVTGLTQFVQHPGRDRLYPVHVGWVVFLLLSIIHFWWFEFGLSSLSRWRFEIYFFLILYAMLFAVLSALLFPTDLGEHERIEEYFQARRVWFYGLLALLFGADVVDTLIKGTAHFNSLGIEYPIRQASFAACSIIALFVSSKRFQAAFVIIGVIYQVTWILRLFGSLP